MRLFGTTVVKYAEVETDTRIIRVDTNGKLSSWDDDRGWVWFDEGKYTAEELRLIRQQGLGALEMPE